MLMNRSANNPFTEGVEVIKKRTRTINLENFRKQPAKKPLAVALISALVLTGCFSDEKDPEVALYRDANECIIYNPDMKQECTDSFAKATLESIETAPRYATQEDCIAEFGEQACIQAPQESQHEARAGGSFWMPMLAGYLFGRMSGGFNAHKPLYAPRGGGMYDSSGKGFGQLRPGEKVRVKPNDLRPGERKRQTLSRGGFGQSVAKQNAAMREEERSNRRSGSSASRSFGG